jgi:succinyldiaminopimelate transaminase
VPAAVRAALSEAADAPGYPPTAGTPVLRTAIAGWVGRTCRPAGEFGVLPTIGSKELVAWLPTLLGLGPRDAVVIPSVCYPTYLVGARLAGTVVIRSDDPAEWAGGSNVRLVWVNSPGNPTGRVIDPELLAETVDCARSLGAVVASDECYLPLGWDATPVSVLSVCGPSTEGVLAVHSLSKRSNLAGYRAGFVAGDPVLVAELLEMRKHSGLMVPAPVQAAMVAALGDEAHVADQRERYSARRAVLAKAFTAAGFRIDNSEAGLYLWATDGGSAWSTVDRLAGLGILVAPGDFYGPAGASHVRIALTASDERCAAAAARLAAVA